MVARLHAFSLGHFTGQCNADREKILLLLIHDDVIFTFLYRIGTPNNTTDNDFMAHCFITRFLFVLEYMFSVVYRYHYIEGKLLYDQLCY